MWGIIVMGCKFYIFQHMNAKLCEHMFEIRTIKRTSYLPIAIVENAIFLVYIGKCTIDSKINSTPKGVYLPISKLHSILVVANLFANNNLWLCFSKYATAKIECSFEMGKQTPLGWYHLFCC